jgi:hypothetical protein
MASGAAFDIWSAKFGVNSMKSAPTKTPRNRGDPANPAADQEFDRKEDGEAVRRDIGRQQHAQRAGNAGVHGTDAKGQRLVKRGVDAHRCRRQRMVAGRDDRTAGASAQQIARDDEERDRPDQAEVKDPGSSESRLRHFTPLNPNEYRSPRLLFMARVARGISKVERSTWRTPPRVGWNRLLNHLTRLEPWPPIIARCAIGQQGRRGSIRLPRGRGGQGAG